MSSLVNEIHRRRISVGENVNLSKSFADVYPFEYYGIKLSVDNIIVLEKKMWLVGETSDNQKFVVVSAINRWSIPEYLSNFDIYIFVKEQDRDLAFLSGWLPNCDITFDSFITDDELYEMPKVLKFQENSLTVCPNHCEIEVWNSVKTRWECIDGCGKKRFDDTTKQWFENYIGTNSN